jgi:hypothetical protein
LLIGHFIDTLALGGIQEKNEQYPGIDYVFGHLLYLIGHKIRHISLKVTSP